MRRLGVIMAGGKGERFWPLSRQAHPKQFLKIKGNKELIEAAVERIRELFDHILIITTKNLEQKIKQRFNGVSIIGEPVGKNTGPCATVATEFAREHGYDLMGVFPADHYIENLDGFARNVKDALRMAERGFIATIGIKPTRPDTGFGYIERGEVIEDGIFKVVKFHEKPELETAKTYVASGRFYWNGGMFFWSPDVFFDELIKFSLSLVKPLEEHSINNLEVIYDKMPSISIDHALLEKTTKSVVIESSFFWEDLGSYIALEKVARKNEDGNVVLGKSIELDAHNNIIVAEDGLVAVIGVEGVVVVHTPDVTLVLPKDKVQDVKKIVKRLREKGYNQYL